jgi:Predicted periplasmic lipoprotein (DUF2279)
MCYINLMKGKILNNNEYKRLVKFVKMNSYRSVFVLFLFTVVSTRLFAQEQGLLPESQTFNKNRFSVVVAGETGVAAVATIGLEYLWYKKFPHSHFHFFNDNAEWLNMDKVGHATTAYNIAALQYNLMRWSGVNRNTSIWIAGATGLAYMSMIEIMDGFSSEWGFSPGDMMANISGCLIFTGQQFIWKEQKIQMRFSFHNSIFSKYNPGELGNNLPQHVIKDYNGQTYWLSFNISSFLGKTNFPKWINADFGYGAEGMTGAVTNPTEVNGKSIPSFTRMRKFFLGVDGAFTAKNDIPFPTWINTLRIPAPVLEWKPKAGSLQFKPLYF